MALPRGKYVQEGQEGVYHCFSRCVRRAFLCGFDKLTLRDYSHRKRWLVDRLRYLAANFAIEVCAYAVMATHYHSILRTRPDLVAGWSDREVATRWLRIFPRHHDLQGAPEPPSEQEILALADCPERIAELRKRLSSLSWFMGRLNEFIARAANKEDNVTGRFWESRFKCQALLDEAAIAAAMVYVDLNPIRAGLAATPEESDFTSIQERIRVWQKETMATASLSGEGSQETQSGSLSRDTRMLEKAGESASSSPEPNSSMSNAFDAGALSVSWLCPISSGFKRRGILSMSTSEYVDLVDRSGRLTRPDKRGAIDADVVPILLRVGANPDAWLDTVSRFGSRFRLVAGMASNLRYFAARIGRHWLQGTSAARASFVTPRPQLA